MSYAKRTAKFKQEWLQKYKWLTAHPTSSIHAYCKLCKVDIHVGSIRLGALESHKKGKKHATRETSESTIRNFLQSLPAKQSSSTSISPSSLESQQPTENISQPTVETSSAQQLISTNKSSVTNFVETDQISKAEILWTLHSTVTHNSFNNSKSVSTLFSEMFPDSQIAQKFACGSTKLKYLVTFGLAPYFLSEIEEEVKDVSHVVVLFDESFNRTIKNEQMDIYLRYWSSEQDQVVTRYLTSSFLGHCTAQDLLKSLKEGLGQTDLTKIVQVSMDGPNVNHKFYKMYIEDRKKENPNSPGLIDISTCGLHVIHGAFKTGANASGWKLDNLLRSLWYLFSDSPARRADYTSTTGSGQFPLQFCSTRWIEDVPVAERAIEIWNDICKYVNSVCSGPKSKKPTSSSFVQVVKAVNDPLTLPKLHVFIKIAKFLSPFLESFQSDKPLVPFLAMELYSVLSSLLEPFVVRSVMDSLTVSSFASLDLDDDKVLVSSKKVSVGFAANEILKKSSLSEAKIAEFKTECRTFYAKTAKKIIERCPLSRALVRNMDCLNPKTLSIEVTANLLKMFENMLSKLVELNRLESKECDDLITQYKSFVKFVKQEHKEEFGEYCFKKSLRLDKFLQMFLHKPESLNLWNLVKSLLILSHGQASVERGFSVNKDTLRPNLTEKNLVALRLVNDTIKTKLGGNDAVSDVHKINITKNMLASCRMARVRYQSYLDDMKKESKKNDTEKRKARLLGELRESKSKKLKLENSSRRLQAEADELFLQAEREKDFGLLSSANDLRRKAKKAETEIQDESETIKLLHEKIQKL